MSDSSSTSPPGNQPLEPDEGKAEFLLGPINNPDGTSVAMNAEVVRRLRTDAFLLQQLGKQFGLDLKQSVETDAARAQETERSTEIKQQANPQMAEAALSVRAGRKRIEITQPDGTRIVASKVQVELDSRLELEKSLRALASVLFSPIKWSGRVAVRCGRWISASVIAGTDDDEKDK